MPDYWFTGAQEYELKAAGAVTQGSYASGWVTLPDAEIYELYVGITAHSGDDCVVVLESDLGNGQHAAETVTITETGALSRQVSLGGQPGGSRVRATWTKGASGSSNFSIMLYECRSGLYGEYYGT